jgi:NADPH:quinone reductase-like Zn-dependent oxidoreductase
MATMKAVRIHSYGGPEVLVYEDMPRPEPAGGEILIRVHAAGVNPLDWKVREGHAREWLDHRLPLILGWDISGIIEAVGSGVHKFRIGDAVYGLIDISRDGAYAEYVTANASHLASKPNSLDHVHAAALPVAALTAWNTIFDTADLKSGQTILIHAAAGGVGHMAVQLAKWKGARVIGTASAGNAPFLRQLGADEVIDYTTTRFEDVVHEVDVVLDTLSGEVQERSWKTLKKGGIMVSTLSEPSPKLAAKYNARGAVVMVKPNAETLTRIAELIDARSITVKVEKVLHLTEVRKAHGLSQSGHARGKIVIKVRD